MGVMWSADANPCPILLTCGDLLASCQHKHLPREARTQHQEWILPHYFLLSHTSCVWRGSSLSPWGVRGQIPPRQDPFLLPWCGCEKGIAEYYSRELDNMLFISRTMQPFSELNKHFTQQYYPWQYYSVPSFHGLSRQIKFLTWLITPVALAQPRCLQNKTLSLAAITEVLCCCKTFWEFW